MNDDDEKTSDIEKSFLDEYLKTVAEAHVKIGVFVDAAHAELDKAVAVSQEYGVPFYSSISFLSQWYRPSSMDKKWGEERVRQLEDYCNNHYVDGLDVPEYEGWAHSSVC